MTRNNSSTPDAFDAGEFGGTEKKSAEFWKPERDNAGDTVFGMLDSIGTGRVGTDATEYLVIANAGVVTKGKAQGFASIKVGNNSVLASRLGKSDVGKPVAITFTGYEQTQSGAMRLYKVHTLTSEGLVQAYKKYTPDAPWLNEVPF